MSLEQKIANWDGKSKETITAIYERFENESAFAPTLVRLSGQSELERGATWLLKRYLESGGTLSAKDVSQLLSALPASEDWEAKLHILQCLTLLRIADKDRTTVEAFVREGLDSDNKFVRAWAYSGFYELARQFRDYRDEAEQLLENAMSREAPSVKARIRNIRRIDADSSLHQD